jgi:hypothetical protein
MLTYFKPQLKVKIKNLTASEFLYYNENLFTTRPKNKLERLTLKNKFRLTLNKTLIYWEIIRQM